MLTKPHYQRRIHDCIFAATCKIRFISLRAGTCTREKRESALVTRATVGGTGSTTIPGSPAAAQYLNESPPKDGPKAKIYIMRRRRGKKAATAPAQVHRVARQFARTCRTRACANIQHGGKSRASPRMRGPRAVAADSWEFCADL